MTFNEWFKENTPKEGLSENTTFSRQFVEDAWNDGRYDLEEYYMNVIESQQKLVAESKAEMETELKALRKANEWQYGTPDTGKDLLCQTAPDEFEVGYYHPEDERFYTMDGRAIDVIAWKKILPPEVKNA